MRLVSENNYNERLRDLLEDFKKDNCQFNQIAYKNWQLHSLVAKHKLSKNPPILIIQGRAETTEKYMPLIYELFNDGFDVYTFDHLGQGFSNRVGSNYYSYIPSFEDYLEPVKTVIDFYNLKNYKVLANSMGGAITIHLLNKEIIAPKQVVLIAPMILWNEVSPFIKKVFLFSAKIVEILDRLLRRQPSNFFGQKKYKKDKFEENKKTHSKNRYEFYHKLYEDNPKLPIGGVTFGWIKAVVKNPITIINAPQTEILVFLAGEEKIVNTPNSQQVINDSIAHCAYIETELIEKGYHDLLYESDELRDPIVQKISSFFHNGK